MKKEGLKLLIFIVILVLLVVVINSTYSKYTEKAIAVVKEDVATWKILINETDITTSPETTEFEVDDFDWTGDLNDHVMDGKVAPGMYGEFQLIIDPSETQVALEYEIKVNKPTVQRKDGTTGEINIVFDDIVAESGKTYTITEDADGNKIIHRIKPLTEVSSTTESQRVDTLLVKVKWDNDETYNDIDSEIGSIYGNKISMPIEVSAIQYIGT